MTLPLFKNSVKRLIPFLLFFAFCISLTSCTKKERFEKEKYDRDLKFNSQFDSDYKECTAYTRTVLLPKRKIIGRFYGDGYFLPETIVEGNNLIALYFYTNNLGDLNCGIIDGWFTEEVYFEFENLQPEIGKQYSLPHPQIKIYYRSENSDAPEVYDHHDLTGKIIFHEFSEDKIKLSLFLEDPGFANKPEERRKYALLNESKLEFKAFIEKFYENDEIEPFIK